MFVYCLQSGVEVQVEFAQYGIIPNLSDEIEIQKAFHSINAVRLKDIPGHQSAQPVVPSPTIPTDDQIIKHIIGHGSKNKDVDAIVDRLVGGD